MNGRLHLSGDEYHQSRLHDSHSSLETFRRSRVAYEAIYVKGTRKREPSPEMEFGTAFHLALLQPALAKAKYVFVDEKLDLRTKVGKAKMEVVQANHPGKKVIWPDDIRRIEAMHAAVMANPLARSLIEAEGAVEEAWQWTDQYTGSPIKCETGLPLKCMPDKLIRAKTHSRLVIVDVKTTRSLEDFPRDAVNYGYHRQAELYRGGVCTAAGLEKVPEFYWLAVESQWPHECGIFEPSMEMQEQAFRENQQTLMDLLICKESGVYVSRYHSAVRTAKLPVWARSE